VARSLPKRNNQRPSTIFGQVYQRFRQRLGEDTLSQSINGELHVRELVFSSLVHSSNILRSLIQSPVVNQVFPDWPVPSTNYKTLYLGPLNQLSTTKAIASSSNSYKADVSALQVDNDSEELTFSYTVTKKSHLVGYPRLVLYMSGEATDLDVFVQLRKADATGKLLQNINIPLAEMGVSSAAEVEPVNPNIYLGPNGILRASRRAIDQKRSKSHWAVHSHTQETEQKVKPGEVVRMEIGLWPTGIVFEAGEKLVLKVAGHPLILAEFEPLRGAFVAENQGRHTVHFGGEHDSHVVIPLVEV
jgi:predicted acyl esterase